MHTDDDIFESLNIGEDGEKANANPDSTAKGGESSAAAENAGGDLQIFEDLDMEERILKSAENTESEKEKAGAKSKHSYKELNTAETCVDGKKLKKEKERKKRLRIRKFIIAAVVELFTLAVIFAYGYFLRSWNLIQRPEINIEAVENNNLTEEKKEEMEKGYWNVAIFGVDSRNDSVVERGLNSDVIIIASINRETGDIKLVSVFRDTYLNISDKNVYHKINAAYSMGGPEQALAALNKNLDLNITDYVAFNWKAVVDGINILQGVDGISISSAELYYINAYITTTVKATGVGSYQLKTTGEQHLDGVQAVAYARLRYMDNDYARTERQRNVIKACFEKAKTADFSVLNNIMVTCFPQVATNINFNDIVALAQNISRYNITDTGGFPWARGEAVVSNRGDCVIPATLESNVIKLHEFLFGDENYTPTDNVLRISETIKENSGIYKEGQVIKSVSTDGGVIQQKTKTPASKASSDGDDDEEEETIGIDDDGNYIYPTDEDGNYIIPTDEDGNIVYPTDEDGNVIRESSAARPTELSDGTEPGEGDPDESDVDEGPVDDEETSSGRRTPADSDGPAARDSESSGPSQSETTKENGPSPGSSDSPSANSGDNYISEGGPGSLSPGNTDGPSADSGTGSDGPSSGTSHTTDTEGPGTSGSSSSGPVISDSPQ